MDRKLATRAMQAHLALCLFAHAVSATVTSGDHSLGMMNLSTAAARKRAVDDPTVVQTWAPTTPCKPSFMVIGGPKCGSTSLFEYLEAHPQVHRPAQKELCFFSEFKRHLRRYQPGLPTTSWPLYQAAFAGRSALRLRTSLDFGGGHGHGRRRGRGRGRGKRRGRGSRVAASRGPEEGAPAAGRRLARGAAHSEADRPERLASWTRALSDAASECSTQQAFEGCPFYLGEVTTTPAQTLALTSARCAPPQPQP